METRLLKQNINANNEDILHYIAEHNLAATLKVLINSRAVGVFDQRDKDGNTPLMIAAQKGYLEIVKMLLSTDKVSINGKNNQGWNAVIFAADGGHSDVLACLLKYLEYSKIDGVNAITVEGKTALMYAARKAKNPGHLKCAALLIEANADTTVTDRYNRMATAQMYASKEIGEAYANKLFSREKISAEEKRILPRYFYQGDTSILPCPLYIDFQSYARFILQKFPPFIFPGELIPSLPSFGTWAVRTLAPLTRDFMFTSILQSTNCISNRMATITGAYGFSLTQHAICEDINVREKKREEMFERLWGQKHTQSQIEYIKRYGIVGHTPAKSEQVDQQEEKSSNVPRCN